MTYTELLREIKVNKLLQILRYVFSFLDIVTVFSIDYCGAG